MTLSPVWILREVDFGMCDSPVEVQCSSAYAAYFGTEVVQSGKSVILQNVGLDTFGQPRSNERLGT
jgi:hypothetical protein